MLFLQRLRILPEEARGVLLAFETHTGYQNQLLRLLLLVSGVTVAFPGRRQTLCAVVV